MSVIRDTDSHLWAAAATLLAILGMSVVLYGHSEKPWVASLQYFKDERTKACFALKNSKGTHYGPYFTYVPCELLDKADWNYYER